MKNKKIGIIIGVVVVLVFIIVIAASNSKKSEIHSWDPDEVGDYHYTENDFYDEDDIDEPISENSNATVNDNGTVNNSKLAKSCQKIIATGVDKNGDIYEIVANVDETYQGSELLVGVIKNSEWLIEPNNECPYINNDRWGWDANGRDIDQLNCGYLSNGTFFNLKQGTLYTPYDEDILDLWNVEINKHLYLEDLLLGTEFVNSYHTQLNQNDKLVLIEKESSGITNRLTLMFLHTDSLDIDELYSETSNGSVGYYSQISEGLFYASIDFPGKKYVGTFYDEDGNKVFDLGGIIAENTNIVSVGDFSDGKCEIINRIENGSRYRITIDKSGNVISDEKIGD